jgi:integrase
VPAFLVNLGRRDLCASRLALEAVILTAARSGEIRGAKWSELDDDLTVWTVPADRIKKAMKVDGVTIPNKRKRMSWLPTVSIEIEAEAPADRPFKNGRSRH